MSIDTTKSWSGSLHVRKLSEWFFSKN